MTLSTDLLYILPELILVFIALSFIALQLIFNRLLPRLYHLILILVLPIITLILIYYLFFPFRSMFSGHFVFGNYGNLLKLIFSVLLFCILIIGQYPNKKQLNFEQYLFLNIQTLAAFLLISSNSIVVLFLTLELIALTYTYFLINGQKSSGIKNISDYLIFELIITSVFLFSLSLLYGTTGSIYLSEMGMVKFGTQAIQYIFALAIIILIFTVILKTRIFNFTFESFVIFKKLNPKLSTILSIMPKIAGIAILGRIFTNIFYPREINCNPISLALIVTLVIIVIFMTYSNIRGLQQGDLNVALWFSANTHYGFIIIGLASLSASSASAGIFYLLFYAISIIGLYETINLWDQIVTARQLSINFKKIMLNNIPGIIFKVNLIGIPFTAGFIGRLELVKGLLSQGTLFILFGIVLIINWLLLLFNIHFTSSLISKAGKIKTKPIGKPIVSQIVIILLTTSILFFGSLSAFPARNKKMNPTCCQPPPPAIGARPRFFDLLQKNRQSPTEHTAA